VPTPLTTSTPWTLTSTLASGLGYTGWGFVRNTSGVYQRISDANYPNAYRLSLVNPYPSTGTPNYTTPEYLTDAITQKQYATVTITPPAGHSLDLRGANIQWTLNPLNNGQSARATALFVGIGGLPALPAVSSEAYDSSTQYPTGIGSPTTFNYYFPVTSAYSAVTQPIEIRVYFYDNIYGFKEIQLNSFQLTGVVH